VYDLLTPNSRYNFSMTWRYSVSVTSSALALQEFNVAPNSVLNYFYDWYNYSSTGGNLYIDTFDNCSLTYLSFSVILSSVSSYFELLTPAWEPTDMTGTNQWQQNGTSQFTWDSSTTDANVVWMVGCSWTTSTLPPNATATRYFLNVSVQTFEATRIYQITVNTSSTTYFSNFKLVVLMVAKLGSTG
jgi:hypothetical protein